MRETHFYPNETRPAEMLSVFLLLFLLIFVLALLFPPTS